MAGQNMLTTSVWIGLVLGLIMNLTCVSGRRYFSNDYDRYATILQNNYDNQGYGQFNYGYQTSNGIRQQATGYIKNPYARPEHQIQVIHGSYSYFGADGNQYTVTYIADENGFQPQGTHLTSLAQPTAPIQYPSRPSQLPSTGSGFIPSTPYRRRRNNNNKNNPIRRRYWQVQPDPEQGQGQYQYSYN